MKKLILTILAGFITVVLVAQPHFATVTGPNSHLKVKQEARYPDQVAYYALNPVPGQKFFDNTIIGTTWYDLQSYTNVMQRIWAYPDGTVGATWMCAGQGLVPERGTGYNYFDGNEWGEPNLHVGPSDRMGWPSYAPWGPNGEIISQYRYVAGEGPIQFYRRENKGEGEWIETILEPPAESSIVWHAMMTSGENHEYIHLLAYTYDTPYNGQDNALLYYRSSDGAETWDVYEEVIDGLGSDYFPTIHSLVYSWANPVGNTIAFTYGFDELGGWVFKSYDNGDNWESMQVVESPLDPFNIPEDSDIIPCGSGTSSCVLDSEGNVHVVFPRMAKVYTAGTLYFYPFTDGLIYWDESMPVMDTGLISSYTLDYLLEAGNLCGWVLTDQPTYTIPDGQPNYNNAMCCYPQLSIDAGDNIYVASCVLAPDYTNGEFYYRHILANCTHDLGASWIGEMDLNSDLQYIFSECAYPELAPVIDNYFYVAFQEDPFPGIAEWLENHDVDENNIMFMAIDKDVFVGIADKDLQSSFDVATYPNPAVDRLYLNLNLINPGNVTIDLINTVGQRVLSQDMGKYPMGNLRTSLDVSHLAPGMYYCTVDVEGVRETRKVVVQ